MGFGFGEVREFLKTLGRDFSVQDLMYGDAVEDYFREEASKGLTISTCAGNFSVKLKGDLSARLALVGDDGSVVTEYSSDRQDLMGYLLSKRSVPSKIAVINFVILKLYRLCGSEGAGRFEVKPVEGSEDPLKGSSNLLFNYIASKAKRYDVCEGSVCARAYDWWNRVVLNVGQDDGKFLLVIVHRGSGSVLDAESLGRLVASAVATVGMVASVYNDAREEYLQIMSRER